MGQDLIESNRERRLGELQIDVFKKFLKDHPNGDYFTVRELISMGFKDVSNRVNSFDGIIPKVRDGLEVRGTGYKYGISPKVLLSFIPMGNLRFGASDQYIPYSVIDEYKNMFKKGSIGIQGTDYELATHSLARRDQDSNARIIRAIPNGGEDPLINVFDLKRYLHIKNYSITEERFQEEFLSFLFDKFPENADDINSIVDTEDYLEKIMIGRSRTFTADYGQCNKKTEKHYHIELFSEIHPALATAMQEFYGFNDVEKVLKKKTAKKAKEIIIPKEHSKHGKKTIAYSPEWIVMSEHERFSKENPGKNEPTYIIQTSGFSKVQDKKYTMLVYGTRDDIDNGATDYFSKEVFNGLTKLNAHTRAEFLLYDEKNPPNHLRKNLNGKSMLALCSSVYDQYIPEQFKGVNGNPDNPLKILFIQTGKVSKETKRLDDLIQIQGTEIIRTRSGIIADRFYCVAMLKLLSGFSNVDYDRCGEKDAFR